MQVGKFYYIKDTFFKDFPDKWLMQNKEENNGIVHDRPCYCVAKDEQTHLYWMIPVSSRITKYQKIYNQKVDKNGYCNSICFGYVCGYEKAFLIQNMFPIKDNYIKNQYFDHYNQEIALDEAFAKFLARKAARAVRKYREGFKYIFPDIKTIEDQLKKNEKKVTNI